jgi:hypothetical protein
MPYYTAWLPKGDEKRPVLIWDERDLQQGMILSVDDQPYRVTAIDGRNVSAEPTEQ